ncbi:MAG TPA: hypothetical protein VMW83_02660 [Spirochaetia bacterium]|nr:hypothetical protein [Spirochaetia bacterium]
MTGVAGIVFVLVYVLFLAGLAVLAVFAVLAWWRISVAHQSLADSVKELTDKLTLSRG